MGLMDYGQGANTFMDNLLRTYLTISEKNKSDQKYEEEQAYKNELKQYINSMNPQTLSGVPDIMQTVGNMTQPSPLQQPAPNGMPINQPQPKSEQEYLQGLIDIQTKYKPEEAMQTRATLFKSRESNESRMAALEERFKNNIELLRMRGDMQSSLQADKLQAALEQIRAKSQTGGGKEKTSKQEKQDVKSAISALDDYSKKFFKPNNKKEILQIEQLKAQLRNGDIQPSWIKYPTIPNEKGGLSFGEQSKPATQTKSRFTVTVKK